MENIQGLNELIKNRLIEKKGNVKLTENNDIILYGKALGISENQLLFKILEIEETIDWSKEKENIIKSETFPTVNNVSTPNNTIYCSNCNAANEKGVANFCVDCGKELRPVEPIKSQSQYYPQPDVEEKSKMPYIIGASVLIVIVILVGVFFFSKNPKPIAPEITTKSISDSTQVQEAAVPISEIDTTSVALSNSTQTSQEDALKILSQYYYDINNSNFDASNYFSENVSQFITRHDITPNDINIIFNQNNEFIRGQSQIVNNEILFERTENNISYYSYWVDYNCYRRSKDKNQFCKVSVEVGFNEMSKIVSYKELKIEDLRFEEPEQGD
jgi:hypothetical protein